MGRVDDVRQIGERSLIARALRNTLFVALTLLFCALALEGVIRLIGVAPPIDWRNGWMESAPGIPYRPRPNSVISGRSQTDEYDYVHRHNSAGFRDDERSLLKSAGTFRILGLGDSFTAGWGAPFEQSYLRRTEVALNGRSGEHPPVEIVKAGINGYFPTSQRMLLESYGIRYRPQLIVVGFVPNDVFDTWMGLDAIVVSKKGWLTSRNATELGGLGIWLYENSHVARIPLDYFIRGKRAVTFDGDWATTIYRPDESAESAWRTVLEEYDRMLKLAREAEAQFAILYIPANPPLTKMHDYPEQRLREWAEPRGVEVISALPEMRSSQGDGPLYWKKDGHCTPEGYRVLAEVLARELDRRQLVP